MKYTLHSESVAVDGREDYNLASLCDVAENSGAFGEIHDSSGLVCEVIPKPLHQHDCDRCHFLGNYGDTMDLYYHPNKGPFDEETVIARFGEMGDYLSGLYSVDHYPELAEALSRWKKRNIP